MCNYTEGKCCIVCFQWLSGPVIAVFILFDPFVYNQSLHLVNGKAAVFTYFQTAHVVPLTKSSEQESFINLASEPLFDLALKRIMMLPGVLSF